MNSGFLLESNIPHALRSLRCVARNLICNCRPVQMRLQTLRNPIFHPLCSNLSQSDERILCLRPGRKSAGVAIVEETHAYLCPKLARVHVSQLDGTESRSYAIQFYITAFG